MKTKWIHACLAALSLGAAVLRAETEHGMPGPAPEHSWLQRFVGSWESELDVAMVPGQPASKVKGAETSRSLGGFWILTDGEGRMEGMPEPMKYLLCLGYDPEKKKYMATWTDSMTSHLWVYEGTVDSAGKVLTLETEGPSPVKPGTRAKFRDVIEFVDADHRTFTSWMQGDDGKWVKSVTGSVRRKK